MDHHPCREGGVVSNTQVIVQGKVSWRKQYWSFMLIINMIQITSVAKCFGLEIAPDSVKVVVGRVGVL